MTTPRKRLEAMLTDDEHCNPGRSFVLVGRDDLKALLSEREVGREALARIIDPNAFKTMREVAADSGLDVDQAPAGVVFSEGVDILIGNRLHLRIAALAKVDAILSLLGGE